MLYFLHNARPNYANLREQLPMTRSRSLHLVFLTRISETATMFSLDKAHTPMHLMTAASTQIFELNWSETTCLSFAHLDGLISLARD